MQLHQPVVVEKHSDVVRATEVQRNFSALLQKLRDGLTHRIVVMKHLEPAIVMLSIDEYDALCQRANRADNEMR